MTKKTIPVETMLETAKEAIANAGSYLMDHFGRAEDVIKKKSLHSITSAQDHESEKMLFDTISSHFPDHSFIGEEGHRKDQQSEYLWIVDPLDGSSHFARGLPSFAISVALMRNNQLEMGIVSCPARDELFHALKGQGANLNGTPIEVSKIANFYECIGSMGHRTLRLDEDSHKVRRLLRSIRSVLVGGSCAQDLCNIACGRLDFLIKKDQNIWDYAAGKLIVEEAGGTISSFYKNQHPIVDMTKERWSFIASNGYLDKEIYAILRGD